MTTTDLVTRSQCIHCGADLEPGMRYCANCGQEVTAASEPPPQTTPTYWRDPEASLPPLTAALNSGGGIGKLFSAGGRIGRLEYVLTIVGIWLGVFAIWGVTVLVDAPFILLLALLAAWLLAIMVSVMAGIKRLHDFDQSGWLILLNLIPFVGFIVLIFLLFKSSSPGLNQFGYADSGSVRK